MFIRLFFVVLILSVCVGCSGMKFRSVDSVMFKSFEDFRPGPKGGVDLVWSAKRIWNERSLKRTLKRYDSVIVDQIWVVVDDRSDNLDDEQIKEVTEHMTNSLKEKLGQRVKIVDEPTKTTLRLSIAITNIETPNPVLAVTSTILPVGIGISTISKIITGEHTNVGSARIELLLSDATTNFPLIAAIDKKSGNKDLGTMVDSLDDAKDAITWWVERLGTTLTDWGKP